MAKIIFPFTLGGSGSSPAHNINAVARDQMNTRFIIFQERKKEMEVSIRLRSSPLLSLLIKIGSVGW